MNARVAIPADPLERRRLWREWIHTDSPRGYTDSPRVETVMARRIESARTERAAPSIAERIEPTPATIDIDGVAKPARPAKLEGDWLPEVIDVPAGVIDGLKQAISDSMEGDRLPIRDRERIIQRSMKLGLNRFEANLLIAAVQYRAQGRSPIESKRFVSSQKRRSRIMLAVTLLIVAETIAAVSLAQFLR